MTLVTSDFWNTNSALRNVQRCRVQERKCSLSTQRKTCGPSGSMTEDASSCSALQLFSSRESYPKMSHHPLVRDSLVASFFRLYLSAHDKLLILGPLKNTYARGWREIDICTRLQGVRTRDKAAVIALRRNLLFSSSLSLTPLIIATVVIGLLSSTLPFLSLKCLNWKRCGPWGPKLLHNQRYLGWVCCGWKGYSCILWR